MVCGIRLRARPRAGICGAAEISAKSPTFFSHCMSPISIRSAPLLFHISAWLQAGAFFTDQIKKTFGSIRHCYNRSSAAQLFTAADHVPFAGPALPRLVLRDALRRAAGGVKARGG